MKVTIDGKDIDLELTEEQKAVIEEASRPNTGWEKDLFHNSYYCIGAEQENTHNKCLKSFVTNSHGTLQNLSRGWIDYGKYGT